MYLGGIMVNELGNQIIELLSLLNDDWQVQISREITRDFDIDHGNYN